MWNEGDLCLVGQVGRTRCLSDSVWTLCPFFGASHHPCLRLPVPASSLKFDQTRLQKQNKTITDTSHVCVLATFLSSGIKVFYCWDDGSIGNNLVLISFVDFALQQSWSDIYGWCVFIDVSKACVFARPRRHVSLQENERNRSPAEEEDFGQHNRKWSVPAEITRAQQHCATLLVTPLRFLLI